MKRCALECASWDFTFWVQYVFSIVEIVLDCVCCGLFLFQILVLSSIRKPKRVTIRGDDEKEYMFLVKGGEDLRLDQRIEQLFGVMNRILQEDPACCQRGLSLTTYNVIPMTPRWGSGLLQQDYSVV